MLKKRVQKLTNFIRHLPAIVKVLLIVNLLLFLVVVSGFFITKQVSFSYSGESCVRELTILPDVHKVSGQSDFSIKHRSTLSIGGLNIASLQSCFSAKEIPKEGSQRVVTAPFGGWFAKRNFAIIVGEPPTIDASVLSDPLPTARALTVQLSQPDVIFEYKMVIGEESTDCEPQNDKSLACDIPALGLDQGKEYTAIIDRMFNGQKVDTVIQQKIKTLVATSVKKTSITNDQTIYSKPKQLSVQFDKPIIDLNVTLTMADGDKQTEIPTVAELDSDSVEVTFSEELQRGKKYTASITDLEAVDGSTLADPYNLTFSTSLGPKVTAVSSGATGVGLSATIVLTFDQALDTSQVASNVVTTGTLSATAVLSSNSISLTYTGANKCTDYTVNVKKGLLSQYDIPSVQDWSYSFRTICHSTSVIGYSVQKRPIIAYTFGSGSKTILYTGTIHGDEYGATALMYAWIDELEANARDIPSGRKVVVVPEINPDGAILGQRYNAHTVDLNRNFDTSDWKKDVVTPANQPLPGGGGSSPMSEPETQAIVAFTRSLQPRLTMSFHGAAGYAIGNLGGDSMQLAAKYSALTGYSDQTGKSDTAFSYAITGTYDDWIREELGLPSVLIELTSNSNSEFYQNRAALWAMVNA